MAQTADKVQVEFTSNIKQLVQDLQTLKTNLNNTITEIENTEDRTDELTESEDELKKVLEKVTSAETSLASALNKVSGSEEDASDKAKKNKDETEKMGESAKDTKDFFDKLNSALGVFGLGFSVSTIISKLDDVINKVKEAKAEVEDSYQAIEYSVGDLNESEKELYNTISVTRPYTDTEVQTAIGYVDTVYAKTATSQQREDIIRENLATSEATNTDIGIVLQKSYEVLTKWGVEVGKQDEALAYLRATTQDTGVSLSDMLSIMADMDEVGKSLNMTFEDMADFVANAGVNISDLAGMGGAYESAFNKALSSNMKALSYDDKINVLKSYGIKVLSDDEYDELAKEQREAYDKAVEKATADAEANGKFKSKAEILDEARELTQEVFQETFDTASKLASQSEASILWSNILGMDVGKITNRFADLSQSNGQSDFGTTMRDKTQSTEEYLLEKGWSPNQRNQIVSNIETLDAAGSKSAEYLEEIDKYALESKQTYGSIIGTMDSNTKSISDSLSGMIDAVGPLALLSPMNGYLLAINGLQKTIVDILKDIKTNNASFLGTDALSKANSGNARTITGSY